jgi:ribosomal protein S18 acetylase RimI-like enzyme
MDTRPANETELDDLATLWSEGWQDAHREILPPALARYRTWESFRERLQASCSNMRVAGPVGGPLGFCVIRDDELYQLYVSKAARGSGIAAMLLRDGESRLAASGVETAWLACAIGNERAAKFYEKNGWRRVGNMINQLPTPDGMFPLEVWRYEKDLSRSSLSD